MRIDADEWQICREQLTAGYQKKHSVEHDIRCPTQAPRR